MRRIEAAIIEVEKGLSTFDFHTLGLPFGGPHGGRDLHRKFFSKRTDFGIEKGDELPTVHFHGRKAVRGTPMEAIPEFIGRSEFMGIEEKGGWFMARINNTGKHAQRLFDAGKKNALRASTGLAGNLHRWLSNGEYTMWVPGEMSLMEKTKNIGAVNDFAIATPILKALYLDNGLEWAEVDHEDLRTTEPRKKILVPKKRIILK